MVTTRYIYFGNHLLGKADEDNLATQRYVHEPDQYDHPNDLHGRIINVGGLNHA